jgi:hypothetical protein
VFGQGGRDDLHGPPNPFGIAADAETHAISHRGGQGDRAGAAADQLHGDGGIGKVAEPLQTAPLVAERQRATPEICLQEAEVAHQIVMTLGPFSGQHDGGVPARYPADGPSRAGHLHGGYSRRDHARVPGHEVGRAGQQADA